MTETPAEPAEIVTATSDVAAEGEVTEEEPRAELRSDAVTCAHCGEEVEGVEADTDFLCPHCERYQDSTICPTCHQVARPSLMGSGEAKEA
jgi:predicted RNA-binding Zn-ribbon protein involved in translation (DUF1610 family)